MQDDANLLRQFIDANDHRAFEILLDRHGPMVLGTARRLVNNRADADDVFQAAFLSLARLAKTIRRRQTLPAWLYTTTCRIAARVRTKRALSIENVPEPSAASAVETDLAWSEVRTALDEELQCLPDRLRSPLLLCYLSGLTRDEAARQLGWSLGTLKRRLEEGRIALRTRLERRGISAAGLALAVLAPAALNAAVPPTLVKTCVAVATGKEIAPGIAVLALTTTTTFKGIAMKAAIISLALVGLGIGIYASFGRADPLKPGNGEKTEESTSAAPKAESLDDPLPAGSTLRFGTSRFRHGTPIVAMAVSNDGKKVATINGNHVLGSARVFDLASGRALFKVKVAGLGAEAVAISPDGTLLVTKEDSSLHIRVSASGEELHKIDLPNANTRSVTEWLAFMPNGKAIVTASEGKVIHLIDLGGKAIRDFAHDNVIFTVAISPDGKQIAAGGYDNEKGNYFSRLWDVETGKELRRSIHGKRGIRNLAFSADGNTVAGGGDDAQLRLWDVATGKEKRAFPPDGYRIRSVAFAPNGQTVAAAGDSIRLYDVTTGNEQLRIDRKASCLLFTDEGKTLTGTVDGAIYRWDANTGKSLTPESAGDSIVDQILVTPDGNRVVTRGQGGDVHIWDALNGKHLRAIKASWQRGIALSPDGRFLVWPVADTSIKFSDPQLPNATYDGARVLLYDMAADKYVERFAGFKGDAHDLTFSADGKALVTVDHRNGMVRLWNVQSGKEERSFRVVPDAAKTQMYLVRRTVVSPDGKTLAVAYGPDNRLGGFGARPHSVRLWDCVSGKELHQLDGHMSYVLDMAFSPDGRLLVTAGDKAHDFRQLGGKPQLLDQVFVWDVAAGKRVTALPDGLPIGAAAVAFSRDGRSLATASLPDDVPIGATAAVTSRQDRAPVTSSAEGTIRIWELATWTVRTEFHGHRDRPTALAFTPAGQLLSGSLDTTVLAWDLRPRQADGSQTLEAAWNNLVKRDAGAAFQSQGRFLAEPEQVVKLLAEKLKPIESVDAARIRRLIADLEDEKFAVRDAASKILSESGSQVQPALEAATKNSTSQELIDRVKKILHEMETISPGHLRQIRAVEVLEWIASDDAKTLLKQWATGVKGAVLTEEAQVAIGRLEHLAHERSAP